ncbi:divalent heavy-metal cation transporter [Tubulinosema ratisbonensis]|uniref:Divalent heavy-metal cation transporter n=1 Tax=Tubulinosema ratisbonensis TaxID=291195 RepID=A0A437AQS7_9MICR|nr:divalent heavy-metal cation transporter [Tubulinosema ratisbonensis]
MKYNTPGMALTFFVVSLTLSMVPFLFNKVRKVKKFFPNLIIFSAGMMLSVALNDLIPHLAVEHDHSGKSGHSHNHSHEHGHKCSGGHEHKFNRGLFLAGLVFVVLLAVDTLMLKHKHCESEKLEDHKKNTHGDHKDHKHDETDCCTDAIKYSTSKIQAFIFVLMISIHSFLEGLGIQSMKTIIALLVHKVIESISIGITIFTANFDFTFALLLNTTYSLLTPLGLLFKNLPILNKAEWFLNGCALGSMFFIVFVEMIPPHFHGKGSPIRKIVFLGTGYTISSLFMPAYEIIVGSRK